MTDINSGVTLQALDANILTQAAQHPRAGAVVTFAGVVRNHDAGDSVNAIEYSAHPTAGAILGEIATEMAGRPGVWHVEAWHRIGHLDVGDVAMVVVVSAEHRGQAFSATSDLVDEVKKRLPVWKNQELTDGSHMWSGIN
jgi:molybdopterin synthase catalytic subunit